MTLRDPDWAAWERSLSDEARFRRQLADRRAERRRQERRVLRLRIVLVAGMVAAVVVILALGWA